MNFKNDTLIVYIVDDDDSVRKGLARLMRSAGIKHRAFKSATEFLAETLVDSHACLLLDINMPHMDGMELVAQLKLNGSKVPIIGLSARDEDDMRQLGQETGVSFFLHKPVDDQALFDAISWVTKDNVRY